MLILTVGLLGLVLTPFLILLAPLLAWLLVPLAALLVTAVTIGLVKHGDPVFFLEQPHQPAV